MKLGLVARAEQRGLGVLTHAVYRHLQPERTLVIDMGPLAGGFAPDFDRYPGEMVVPFDGHLLPEHIVRKWLRGLDVVYMAETAYDWRMVTWAREEGVRTVLHSMPEFWKHGSQDLPMPDAVWNPTCWLHELLPPGSHVVPVPVEDDVWPIIPAGGGELLEVVHVAGHRAAGDRNGTLQLLAAARLVRKPMRITVHCQDERLPRVRTTGNVELRLLPGGQEDRASLYAGAHIMVLPRRYGGLCLPAQEALGAGLALAMPLSPPNPETWPILPLRGRWDSRQPTPSGGVRSFATDPVHLARTLDNLAGRPEYLAELQQRGVEWAKAHSWSELGPMYRRMLEEVCS